MAITEEDFAYIQDLMVRLSGIHVEPGLRALVETRIDSLLRQERLTSPAALMLRLRTMPQRSPLHRRLLESLTNHETAFFRDLPMFEGLRGGVLPELMARRARTRELNLWCSACSFGQEPYSIAMLLEEEGARLAGWRVRLLATDLSEEALVRASAGYYGQLEVNRGLPARLLVRYFRQEGGRWRIHEDIRRRVEFRQLNLVEGFLLPRPMDLIFLRNALIYWDRSTRQAVLARIKRWLARDGYLVLGAAETTLNLDEAFECVHVGQSTWYRLRDRAAPRHGAEEAAPWHRAG